MEAFNELLTVPPMPGLPPSDALSSREDFHAFLGDPNNTTDLFNYLTQSAVQLPLLHDRINRIRAELIEFENSQRIAISASEDQIQELQRIQEEMTTSSQSPQAQLQQAQNNVFSNAASAVTAARTISELREQLNQSNNSSSATIQHLSTQVAELTQSLNNSSANLTIPVPAPTGGTSTPSFTPLSSSTPQQLSVDAPITNSSMIHRSSHSPKHPDPEKFTGERDDLDRFLSHISMKLMINGDWFPTEQAKVAYIASRLDGVAHRQFLTQFKKPDLGFSVHTDLTQALERAFGDADPQATAQVKLDQLYQRNTDLVNYLASFNRYAYATGYNDTALIRILFDHSADELRAMQLTTHRPKDLLSACDLLMELDARLKLNQNPARMSSYNKPRSRFQVPFAQSSAGSTVSHNSYGSFTPSFRPKTVVPSDSISSVGGDPMDLSSIRRRVPQEEKDRRRAAGLCGVCASSTHMAAACPDFKCFNCHKQGHAWNRCPQKALRIQQTDTVANSEAPSNPGNA